MFFWYVKRHIILKLRNVKICEHSIFFINDMFNETILKKASKSDKNIFFRFVQFDIEPENPTDNFNGTSSRLECEFDYVRIFWRNR